MPYLNLDLDWYTHRKARRLVGLLGNGADSLPIKLWAYAGKYHPEDGQLIGYSAGEIEAICGWAGEAGKLVDAMVAIRLIDVGDGFYQIHDWLDHCGHLAAFKKRAKKANAARWSKYASSSPASIPNELFKQSSKESPEESPSNEDGLVRIGRLGPDKKLNGVSHGTVTIGANRVAATAGKYSKFE